jgi:hypothetical protein
MNLFILDQDPKISAMFHTDRHVVKMPTETAQMISFIYHDKQYWSKEVPDFIMGFSKTHYKHPCSIWIRESIENFIYACKMGLALYEEYQFRYNKPDKHTRAKQIFEFALNNIPNINNVEQTPFALAMDTQYIVSDCPIENYRNYYKAGKNHLFNWKNRPKPYFL